MKTPKGPCGSEDAAEKRRERNNNNNKLINRNGTDDYKYKLGKYLNWTPQVDSMMGRSHRRSIQLSLVCSCVDGSMLRYRMTQFIKSSMKGGSSSDKLNRPRARRMRSAYVIWYFVKSCFSFLRISRLR